MQKNHKIKDENEIKGEEIKASTHEVLEQR